MDKGGCGCLGKERDLKGQSRKVWKQLTFKHSSEGSLDILHAQGDLHRTSGLSLKTDFPLPGAFWGDLERVLAGHRW